MPTDQRDQALLYDMLDAALHLERIWTDRSREDLMTDRTLQWATDRGFNIIGEAARQVSESTKASHPEIAWRRIVGLRNVIVHNYADVDYSRHWRVLQEDLPRLIEALKRIKQ